MTITAHLVQEDQRMDTADAMFGLRYPLVLEPCIYEFAEDLCSDYHGGYWAFHVLSNGGFYMAPVLEDKFKVSSQNGFEGEMSADALGITACMFAYSNLSFGTGKFAETCAQHFHLLREFVMGHAEARAILAAID